jgi:hypothetical protein
MLVKVELMFIFLIWLPVSLAHIFANNSISFAMEPGSSKSLSRTVNFSTKSAKYSCIFNCKGSSSKDVSPIDVSKSLDIVDLLKGLAKDQICVTSPVINSFLYSFCFSGGPIRQTFDFGDRPERRGGDSYVIGQIPKKWTKKEIFSPSFLAEGGDICEGGAISKNKPKFNRFTMVEFFCNPNETEMKIFNVAEPKPCTYTISIATNRVCIDNRYPAQRSSSRIIHVDWFMELSQVNSGESKNSIICQLYTTELRHADLLLADFDLVLKVESGPVVFEQAEVVARHLSWREYGDSELEVIMAQKEIRAAMITESGVAKSLSFARISSAVHGR